MRNWSKKRKLLVSLFVFFLAIQAIRPLKNNGNPGGPADITKIVKVPDSVMSILKKSCYDCHSNYTSYPWYDKITPVNWWLTNHINEGKRNLNFTNFGDNTPRKMKKKLEEIAQTVEKNQMPLNSYLWIHKNAGLNATEKQMIADWVAAAKAQLLK